MYNPGDVVWYDTAPLASRQRRAAVVMAESGYSEWAGTARYNIVCLTTDFKEYSENDYTVELDKHEHTDTGRLYDHSLICPWATLAAKGRELSPMVEGVPNGQVTLTDAGHELACRAVYSLFSSGNAYKT